MKKKLQFLLHGVEYVMKLLEKIYYQLHQILKEYFLLIFIRSKINQNINNKIIIGIKNFH